MPQTPHQQPEPKSSVVPMIPVDYILHTPDRPFCPDPSCPCHEDKEQIRILAEHVQDGLLTPNEATNIVKGKHI